MARHKQQDNKQPTAPAHPTENAATTITPRGANTAQGEPLPPLVNPSVVLRIPVATPTRPEPAKRDPNAPVPKPPPRFKVVAERRIANNGMVATLKAGKIVDERDYNLDLLRDQGVQLEPIDPPEQQPTAD